MSRNDRFVFVEKEKEREREEKIKNLFFASISILDSGTNEKFFFFPFLFANIYH